MNLTTEDINLGVAIAVRHTMQGRTGHGGAPIVKRTLTPDQLNRFGHRAVQRALDVMQLRERQAKRFPMLGDAWRCMQCDSRVVRSVEESVFKTSYRVMCFNGHGTQFYPSRKNQA